MTALRCCTKSRWGLLHVHVGALRKHSGLNGFPILQCDKAGGTIALMDLGTLKGENVRTSVMGIRLRGKESSIF